MENIPMDTQILEKWVKCGFVETSKLFPTEEGALQGGTILPVLMNMTLIFLDNTLAQMPQRLNAFQTQLEETYHQQEEAKAELAKQFSYEEICGKKSRYLSGVN